MTGPRHLFENQLVGRKPLCSVMFKKPQIARKDRAENAVHRDVERRIIVSDDAERLFCTHFRQKLFFDFSDDAVFGSRAGLDFAAGNLPPAFPVAVAAPGGERFFLVRFWVRAEYYGSAHGDFFSYSHFASLNRQAGSIDFFMLP